MEAYAGVYACRFHGTNARDPGSWIGQHKDGHVVEVSECNRVVSFN